MVLSDRTIERLIAEGRIAIDPYDVSLLQPSSVDVRVDRYFRVFHNARYPYIDVKLPQEELTEQVEIDDDRPFILHPGEFVLGSTLERVTLPDDLVARLEGKSSFGRLGLLIHSTAGFIDPGWDGHVTLELSNVANLPITIYHGMKIGQISFMQLTEPTSTPVRHRVARLEVPGPARARRRPATGRTSSREDPRHRRHRLRRPGDRPCTPRGEPRRPCARPPARAGVEPASLGVELAARRRHRPGEPEGGRRGLHARGPPRRDHPGASRRLRSGDDRRDAERRRGSESGGRRAVRADERARHERDAGASRTTQRSWPRNAR